MSHQIGDMVLVEPLEYEDGRTIQAYKDQCDVNKIVARFAREGTLSHLEQFGGTYGDFSDFDFLEAQLRLARGKSVFEALPGEVQRQFDHSPQKFFEFVSKHEVEELKTILPQLADRGFKLPDVSRGLGSEPAEQDLTAKQTAPEAEQGAPQPENSAN